MISALHAIDNPVQMAETAGTQPRHPAKRALRPADRLLSRKPSRVRMVPTADPAP